MESEPPISEDQNALEDSLEERLSSALMAFCFERLSCKNENAAGAAYWRVQLDKQLKAFRDTAAGPVKGVADVPAVSVKMLASVACKGPRLRAAVEIIYRTSPERAGKHMVGMDDQELADFWALI